MVPNYGTARGVELSRKRFLSVGAGRVVGRIQPWRVQGGSVRIGATGIPADGTR